jgi:hypothetical protein
LSQRTPQLSIIIPLAPSEQAWRDLLPDLLPLCKVAEVILSVPDKNFVVDLDSLVGTEFPVRVHETRLGRAFQMNGAAVVTKGEYLWILHADSRLNKSTLQSALNLSRSSERSLYYFDLVYQNDGPRLTMINLFFTHLRSRVFGLPFGDQGFLLSRDLFEELGGFPEDCLYGEDHLFVWKAKHAGVKVQAAGSTIVTSARRYKQHGWLNTTLLHARRFIAQLLPELLKSFTRGGKE